ncbi:hypothetical protein [Frigidibacter sp. SD6-1]|uniref:hypothetical protein n=1 Tax=Frigidibacter sp. SD6-1 TaxID=3032581 RepID=UPI0024DF540E|nr:hypothetical protein [Frigidibacter sp. SD6-1]
MTTLAAIRLPVVAALSALTGFALWQLLAFSRAGTFEYPLDDTYIHLAMAEGIAGGTYGINPGEPASAASSILYPILLLPFAGSDLQRFLPLLWNTAALLALAFIWGRIVREAALTHTQALFLALIGPFALGMPSVAALGMEHSLHALAVGVLVQGLWRFLTTGSLGPALVLSAVIAPLMRYEGLALSLLAAGVLVLRGRVAAGLALGVAVVAGPVLFGLFLMGQGLDPLPSSVLAKLGDGSRSPDPVARFLLATDGPGADVFLSALGLLGLAFLSPVVRKDRNLALLGAVVGAAALAHLLSGSPFYFNRYEHYVMVMTGVALVLALPRLGRRLRQFVPIAMVLWALSHFWYSTVFYTWNPRSVHLEQEQMARLTDLLPGEPVAVNDIGKVAWKRDVTVLDLWGLASREARLARLPGTDGAPAPAGWADALVKKHRVRYAMIYDEWIATGIGADWRPVAQLTMSPERGLQGGAYVTIYATDPAFEPALRKALQELAATLPDGAILTELD